MSEKDYLNFLNSYSDSPSKDLDLSILNMTKRNLKKDFYLMIFQVMIIHSLAGLITLSFCPQFGWNPFGASPHLTHIFMNYGVWACGLFCGMIFMSVGSILKIIILNRSFALTYKNKLIRNSIALSSIFVSLLMIMGSVNTQEGVYISFTFVLFWLMGSVISDFVTLKFIRI